MSEAKDVPQEDNPPKEPPCEVCEGRGYNMVVLHPRRRGQAGLPSQRVHRPCWLCTNKRNDVVES